MITYTTKENDVLDWIVWRHYGTTSVLEQVMSANTNITAEKLPAGIEIKLPYIEAVKTTKGEIKLWN